MIKLGVYYIIVFSLFFFVCEVGITVGIRESFEERERSYLSPYACLSSETRGRQHPLASRDDMRTDFQRDRDRIIHCKSFRRLMHKTQVFLSPEHDHYRTRLTHTLEVCQVSRAIARALLLNEDLCEAVALGHDLGHTPFGHAGERVLIKCYDPDFSHCKQSLRVADKLENLNLTYEVLDGILNHSGNSNALTLEGTIVKYADRIAYINHDIDDAVRGGIISLEDIPTELRKTLGDTSSTRINTMVRAIVSSSAGKPEITMDPEIYEATMELRAFLFGNVYTNSEAKAEEGKAERLTEALYHHFCEHPEEMPADYVMIANAEGVERAVCDFIASMTDRYAISVYKKIFVPETWSKNNG